MITIVANSAGSILCLQSENEALQKGDLIKKIDDYDARDVRHVDAQNLLQNSETIKLVVERSEPSSVARTSSRTTTDTIITASPSPPTIFRPIASNGAAATSLSEWYYLYYYYAFFLCHHNNDTTLPPQNRSTPLINSPPRLISFSFRTKHDWHFRPLHWNLYQLTFAPRRSSLTDNRLFSDVRIGIWNTDCSR